MNVDDSLVSALVDTRQTSLSCVYVMMLIVLLVLQFFTQTS